MTVRWLARAAWFPVSYAFDMVRSALRVAHDVVTPTSHMRPQVVAVPLRATTDAEIAVVANLVSLTPGTLTLDVSPDRTHLIVHVMFADRDVDQIRVLEDRVLRLLRGDRA